MVSGKMNLYISFFVKHDNDIYILVIVKDIYLPFFSLFCF